MSTYDERLKSFAELQEDWDSYGASPINPDAIEGTKVLLDAIRDGEAQVFPTRDGGCQIEVHCNGWDIEFELDPHEGIVDGLFERAK